MIYDARRHTSQDNNKHTHPASLPRAPINKSVTQPPYNNKHLNVRIYILAHINITISIFAYSVHPMVTCTAVFEEYLSKHPHRLRSPPTLIIILLTKTRSSRSTYHSATTLFHFPFSLLTTVLSLEDPSNSPFIYKHDMCDILGSQISLFT